jgi:hypothetical protein
VAEAQRKLNTMDKLASDAIFLAIGTILSYFYVYCFEIGYCFHFGFPSGIFPITLSNILHAWFLLTFYVIFVFGFLQLNLQYWPATQKHVAAFVFVFFGYLFCLITILTLFRDLLIIDGLNFNIHIFLAFWLSSAIGLCAVRIYNRDVAGEISPKDKNDSGRIDREDAKTIFTVFDRTSNISFGSIGHMVLARLGFDPLIIILVFLLFLPGISLYAGWANAYSQTVFYVYERINDHQNQIVLKIAEGQLISAPYDPIYETYKARFVIVRITDPIIAGLVVTYVEKLQYETSNNKK